MSQELEFQDYEIKVFLGGFMKMKSSKMKRIQNFRS